MLRSSDLEVCSVCGDETVRPSMIVWEMQAILPRETITTYSRSLHEFCEDCASLVRVRLFAAIEHVIAAVREEQWSDENR
jgi:hypothetical protein